MSNDLVLYYSAFGQVAVVANTIAEGTLSTAGDEQQSNIRFALMRAHLSID